MLRTRLLTSASKLFFGLTAGALAALVVWGFGADWNPLGNVLFISLAAAAGFLGGVVIAFRDATAEASAEAGAAVAGPAPMAVPWPLVGAFGVVVVALGLVTEVVVVVAGFVLVGIAILEWMVAAWADDLSTDPAYNRSVRNRIMYPIEVPVAAVLVAAVVIIGFSRVLLALPKIGATTGFGILAAIVFFVGIVIALRPRVSRNVVSGILVLGGIGIIAGGIAGAVVGEREFKIEEPEEFERAATVADRAAADAIITLEDGEFSVDRIEIPRAATATFIFENKDEEAANLRILAPGEPQTPLREGPAEQALIFRIDVSGTYEFVNDANPDQNRGEVVVIGVPPRVTTTTTEGEAEAEGGVTEEQEVEATEVDDAEAVESEVDEDAEDESGTAN